MEEESPILMHMLRLWLASICFRNDVTSFFVFRDYAKCYYLYLITCARRAHIVNIKGNANRL